MRADDQTEILMSGPTWNFSALALRRQSSIAAFVHFIIEDLDPDVEGGC